MTDKATLDQLRVPDASFTGEVVRPGDPGYEDVRRVHNASIDKRPALILRCRSTADVVAALAVGRESGLEVAVRGGGHSIAGRSTTDGGVLIDLSPMKGIVVNPTTRTVRVQGGATWRELNREAAVHDLATTGGVISTTGTDNAGNPYVAVKVTYPFKTITNFPGIPSSATVSRIVQMRVTPP